MALAQRRQARDWPFSVTPLHDTLGCEITGITLAQAVEPKLFGKVYEAFLDYELILFRDVDLDSHPNAARRPVESRIALCAECSTTFNSAFSAP